MKGDREVLVPSLGHWTEMEQNRGVRQLLPYMDMEEMIIARLEWGRLRHPGMLESMRMTRIR